MKLTTAAILAFACTSVLANSAPYKETGVYARGLYERDKGEGYLESLEKRRRSKSAPSLSRSFSNAAGNIGGVLASNVALYALKQQMMPQAPPTPPQQQRRSLDTRMRRRRLANPRVGSFVNSLGPMRKKGKGMAASFFDGFAQGVAGLDSRGLEEDVLDELD